MVLSTLQNLGLWANSKKNFFFDLPLVVRQMLGFALKRYDFHQNEFSSDVVVIQDCRKISIIIKLHRPKQHHTFTQSAPHSPSTFDYFVFPKMFFTYYSVLAYTKTVSSVLTLDQIAPTCFCRVLRRKFKKVQTRHTSITIIFITITLSCCTLLSTASEFPFLAFFTFLVIHFPRFVRLVAQASASKREREESEYRVSLVPVQKLRRLDQNSAVS